MIRLRPLAVGDEAQALAAHAELAAEDFPFLLGYHPGEAWSGFVARLRAQRRGTGLPEGWVPATYLVGEAGGEIVGRVSIRHRLTDWLERYGGHIGYAVRPAYRRRGYAAQMLRQSLTVAARAGVSEALVICEDTNPVSAAVIERCGGRRVARTLAEDGTSVLRHYRVPTS
ncbi:MAG: GNAT family N-acetyltransferase [Kineosporiaceae bacterium]